MAEVKYDKLTIYEVEEFYNFLLEKLKSADSILELDFSNVEKIDMVAIQLLLSLKYTCKNDSIELVLKNFSTGLINTLKACGCDSVLEVKND
jgi:anti-anti-sigma regulatory factor